MVLPLPIHFFMNLPFRIFRKFIIATLPSELNFLILVIFCYVNFKPKEKNNPATLSTENADVKSIFTFSRQNTLATLENT